MDKNGEQPTTRGKYWDLDCEKCAYDYKELVEQEEMFLQEITKLSLELDQTSTSQKRAEAIKTNISAWESNIRLKKERLDGYEPCVHKMENVVDPSLPKDILYHLNVARRHMHYYSERSKFAKEHKQDDKEHHDMMLGVLYLLVDAIKKDITQINKEKAWDQERKKKNELYDQQQTRLAVIKNKQDEEKAALDKKHKDELTQEQQWYDQSKQEIEQEVKKSKPFLSEESVHKIVNLYI